MHVENLETSRLTLRDMTLDDAEALHAIEGDPRAVRYTEHETRTLDEVRELLAQTIEDQQAKPRTVFDLGVVVKATGEFIGRSGFRVDRPVHREAMLWYVLHPDHWGNGYAVEAARAVCDFAFGRLDVHRIFADCDPRNQASARVAEKLGMTLEGHLRENYFLKGEWCDSLMYAVLDREFQRTETRET